MVNSQLCSRLIFTNWNKYSLRSTQLEEFSPDLGTVTVRKLYWIQCECHLASSNIWP